MPQPRTTSNELFTHAQRSKARGSIRWQIILITLGGLIMAMMLGLGLSPAQKPAVASYGSNSPAIVAGSISVSDFARDRVLFDSGVARDVAGASVPLSGRAQAGAVIQARAVADNPESATPWIDIATADASGRYSGTLPNIPVSSDWMLAEVRLKSSPSVRASTSTRFGVGHALAFWGQSELARFLQAEFADRRAAPSIADESALQVYYSEDEIEGEDYGSPGRLRGGFVTNAEPWSKHAAALSNVLSAAYPGTKFSIALHASGGTSRNQSAASEGNSRNRPGEIAIRDLHAPHPGMEPGVAYSSWFFNDLLDAGSGTAFADEAFRFVTGRSLTGADDDQFSSHLFPDVYDPSKTLYGISLHRYDGMNSIVIRMAGARTALREMFAGSSNLPAYLREGTSALTYASAPSDSAHPVTGLGYEDGMVRLFRHLVAGAMRVSGVARWDQPEFDAAELAPDRSLIEVWSEAGPITTHRLLAGEALPDGYPQIWGFRHNGIRSEARIVGGRVHVLPMPGRAAFADGDVITFASDGAGADPDPRANLTAAVWKDHPVVEIENGPRLLEAVPIRAATPQSVLGVIPRKSLAPDPNPNPNGASPNFSAAIRAEAGRDGWVGDPAVWTFNGDGSLQSEPVSKMPATGIITPKAALEGKSVELSFVMSSPDLAFGDLDIRVSTQGGGRGTPMFADRNVPIALDERTTLELGVVPSANRRIEVEIRRQQPVSGRLVFKQVTMKEVLP